MSLFLNEYTNLMDTVTVVHLVNTQLVAISRCERSCRDLRERCVLYVIHICNRKESVGALWWIS